MSELSQDLIQHTQREEVSQAAARLAFSIAAPAYLLSAHEVFGQRVADHMPALIFSLAGIFIYSLAFYLWIRQGRAFSVPRQWSSVIFDVGSVSLVMVQTGGWGAALYPLYIWIVCGNIMRFGQTFHKGSMLLAVIGFGLVIGLNTYWLENLPAGIGLLCGLILVPTFFAVLFNRLHTLNAHLDTQYRRAEFSARHDPLTLLPNRVELERRLLKDVEDATKSQMKFAVFFLDVDRFKDINDRYGHKVGDIVLRYVAKTLHHHYTGHDLVCRFGGDEFVVVKALVPHSLNIGSEMRTLQNILDGVCVVDENEIPVTVSIGVACFPEEADNAEALIDLADSRMYAVKMAADRPD